jgi:hypothetical protein
MNERLQVEAVIDLVRSLGNPSLGDRLQAAHDRFTEANDRRGKAVEGWRKDLDSPSGRIKARAADEAAEEAAEALERVMADVSAFLASKGGRGG